MIKLAIAIYFMLLGAFVEAMIIGVWFHFQGRDWNILMIGLLLIPLGGFVFAVYENL